MKITNAFAPSENEVGIERMSITYTQNNDCTEDNDNGQYLTVEMRNGGVTPDTAFLRITTDGWSVDKPSDIEGLLTDFMKRFNIGSK